MSLLFALIFVLAGLALAIFLALVLYKDEKQEPLSRKNSRKLQDERKVA
jgi:hypothetical protein